jgi:hypothetical protein
MSTLDHVEKCVAGSKAGQVVTVVAIGQAVYVERIATAVSKVSLLFLAASSMILSSLCRRRCSCFATAASDQGVDPVDAIK